MRIGLSDELHAPCGSELLEAVDQCRLVVLHLLKSQPRDREAYTEVGVSLQQLEEHVIGWNVARISYALEDLFVEVVIGVVVGVADVEEAIATQSIGLMYLEAEAYLFHNG